MKIWIHLNGMQQGPYDPEQLRVMSIGPDTPVWYEGLPGWLPASKAPATASLFAETQPTPPPPPSAVTARNQNAGRPPTFMGWSILLTVLCCSPIALVAIITGAMSSSRYNAGDLTGAQRLSVTTEWLLIFAIVFALVTAPLGMVFFF